MQNKLNGSDEKWYDAQVSDTTMMTIAASLPGQQKNNLYKRKYFYGNGLYN